MSMIIKCLYVFSQKQLICVHFHPLSTELLSFLSFFLQIKQAVWVPHSFSQESNLILECIKFLVRIQILIEYYKLGYLFFS